MKSVVMIVHDFPPEGSAGVYRPLRFVRHLPSEGWRPVVIAGAPDCCQRYDPGLLELVPPSTEVVRVPNPDPWKRIHERRKQQILQVSGSAPTEAAAQIHQSHERRLRSALRNVVRRIESLAYRPDSSMCWIRPATNAAVEACARNRAEVVWATGGPWSSLVVGRNVSSRTHLPYVLDFRDPWTLAYSEFHQLQPEWIRARDRQLLSRLFSGAQAVVFRYMSEAEAYWRAYPGVLDPERIHVIPNGYDGSVSPFNVPRGDRCTVLYTGTVAPYWHETVLEALAQLRAADPVSAGKLRFLFVGEDTQAVTTLSNRLGLSGIVEVKGLVSHTEANRLQSEAHGLLLLGWKPARGHELGGSKIFGYLKAGRPIVAVLPGDEQSKIMRSVGVSTLAYAGSHEEIIGVFRRLLDAWTTDNLPSLLPNRAACETYSAGPQTRALVRALEGLPANEPFRPGAAPVPPSLEKLIGPKGWVKPPQRRRASSIPAAQELN